MTTNIGPMIQEELADTPGEVASIVSNLFHAVKLISARVLPHVPATSNVVCKDGVLRANKITSFFKGEDMDLRHDQSQSFEHPKISFLKTEDDLGDKVTLVDLIKAD